MMSPDFNKYVRWLASNSSLPQSFLLHSEEKLGDPDTFPLQSHCASEKLAMLVVYTLFESSPKDLDCFMHGAVSKGAPSIILATFKLPVHTLSLFVQPICVFCRVMILKWSPFSSSDFTYAVLLIPSFFQ